MPHDRDGNELKVGDTVSVPCVVKSICVGEYCNTSLETVEVMPGNGTPTQISAINCKQVVKVCGPDNWPLKGTSVGSWLNPAVLVEYAGAIDAAVTELLRAGLPKLLVADKCLHVVIEGLQAGKSAAEVAADLVTRWKAGGLSG